MAKIFLLESFFISFCIVIVEEVILEFYPGPCVVTGKTFKERPNPLAAVLAYTLDFVFICLYALKAAYFLIVDEKILYLSEVSGEFWRC